MSRSTKIALGIIGGLVALCVLAVVSVIVVLGVMGPSLAKNMVISDPAKVVEAAGKIAEYELPAGYKELTVMNMGVEKMLLIGAEEQSDRSSQPMITLLQLSSFITSSQKTNQESFEQQMRQSMGQTGHNQAYLQLVDEKEVEIDGQTVSLLIYEGENGTGVQIRQVISDLFEVKDAQVMLMIMGRRMRSTPSSRRFISPRGHANLSPTKKILAEVA